MKKTAIFLLAAFVSCCLQACNDSDGDYAGHWAFATACPLDNNDYYFRLDDDSTLYPGDKSRMGVYQARENQRVIVFFNFLREAVSGYDRNIALYDVQEIDSGQTLTVETHEQADELPDARTSFFGARLNRNYLNLGIGFNASDLSKHLFYLVHNTVAELDPKNTLEGYLNLELRHEDGSDTGRDHSDRYVSFRLGDDFKALLEGQQGIILRVNTRMNGIRYIRIELPQEK